MKKYLLVFIALLLTGVVVTATVLNSNKKPAKPEKAKKECTYKKGRCAMRSAIASY